MTLPQLSLSQAYETLKFDGGYKGAVELYVEKEARASRKHECEPRKMPVLHRTMPNV